MPDMKLDPLFKIFEEHLYNFNDATDTEQEFISRIVQDYLKFLNSNGAIVPNKHYALIAEEIHDQVRKMLLKKMYGCLNIQEFLEKERELELKKNSNRIQKKKRLGGIF